MRCTGSEDVNSCIWWVQSKSNAKEDSYCANPSVSIGIKITCEHEHAKSIRELQSANVDVLEEVHQQNMKRVINN
jgi:hypothetical protein